MHAHSVWHMNKRIRGCIAGSYYILGTGTELHQQAGTTITSAISLSYVIGGFFGKERRRERWRVARFVPHVLRVMQQRRVLDIVRPELRG